MKTQEQIRGEIWSLAVSLTAVISAFIFLAAFSVWVRGELRGIDADIREMRAGLSDRPEMVPLIYIEPEEIKADKPVSAGIEPVYLLDDEERDLIAAVCFFEDRSGGMPGMTAVAEVVLNRLSDGRFGDKVAEICTADQFHGLKQLGTLSVTEDAYQAVIRVFDYGINAGTNGALYFCTGSPDNIKKGLVEVARAGGHVFYKESVS